MDRCYLLLLDDDEDDFQLLKSFLRDAFDEKIVLDWFQRIGFTDVMICSGYYLLALIEYQLGNENGLEVIRKAKERCPEQKILLLTSWDEQVVTDEQALQAGADQVLRKSSLSIDQVRQIISPYLMPNRCPES
jgi:ActR/RegA family two-component response regulator